ncbi:MAG: TRC40/GET3/ArsA family transport-energizing ATPase [Sphaerospermopsis sp.]|uniref:ArsA family ATPase n=1 Tax=Sphaerospermopsis sp. LEGE 00249 TaxID=1380707 RepID=UPI00164EA2C9|nr:TRC40/GET3/ArsA family transport-energizing ATPase [Sphaerospermopsis sp. LEGE 00249]MBC5796676.1 ArsA family ATPase [Sphaerospermopsis sp. LEGE 00249]MEB3147781.1 TRC40/GET3/ArsA family transport-energizing ATPase [Sphaerospermopsis sp.]
MNQYDSLNLLLFSGKGGVGKTTMSCCFARYWATKFPEEKILLLSTDPAHSLGDVLLAKVTDDAAPIADLPNLSIQALDAQKLLLEFRAKYSQFLELLVERGSLADGEDLAPVWDLNWPGLNELMGLLEIQRLLSDKSVDRIVVDMAPSGHTLNLLRLKDFLDVILNSLELFQKKHQVITETFTGSYTRDEVDNFLADLKFQLSEGRRLLQDNHFTGCLVIAIAEPMCLAETERFLEQLKTLDVPYSGILINRILTDANIDPDRYAEQEKYLQKFLNISQNQPVFIVPQQPSAPLGNLELDHLAAQIQKIEQVELVSAPVITWPVRIPPSFSDFLAAGCQLIIVGGKGGVGKTTVSAAMGWAFANHYPEQKIRVISIDPAHSLGDAFGEKLGHQAKLLAPNLSGQEIDADKILDQFRTDYLWELADMISGEGTATDTNVNMAYLPEAWRQIMSQALPGIDEMLSLITIINLLESNQQDLIILDTAPTGHLLQFLAMPSALGDWLSWIFKLWMKYQDVLGRVDFIGRLRNLRQQVIQAQKKLKDPKHTQFIGVIQAEEAIIAEHIRLTESLKKMGIQQRYVVQNRYNQNSEINQGLFSEQTIIRLPQLPRSVEPIDRIKGAADLLFAFEELTSN